MDTILKIFSETSLKRKYFFSFSKIRLQILSRKKNLTKSVLRSIDAFKSRDIDMYDNALSYTSSHFYLFSLSLSLSEEEVDKFFRYFSLLSNDHFLVFLTK